jgi:SPP1 family phage portal protein
MKSKGVLNLTEKDSDAKWLIKNINDVANKNTLQNIKDGLYEISSHFNFNDKLASNTSSLALKNQLIDLEQKCTHDIQSMEDGIKSRIKFLFLYLYKRSGLQYNWLDVDIKFSPNIPSDDLMMANIISQLNGKLSIKTGLKQLSFVDNVDNEIKELEKENQATSIRNDLLNNARTSTINNGGDNNGQAV